jgi:histidyl-tRNA synthetase
MSQGPSKIPSVRGMNDVLPPDSSKWLCFERACRDAFERCGYREVRPPIVEHTALFARGVGEATDIVEKEMYTFTDRKQRSLTLRPEVTAGCVRAYIEHARHKIEPVTRWYYIGPNYRYEKVQAGRYRQFYQIGIECFGIAEPSIDAEQIAMLYGLYTALGVPGLTVQINNVGGEADRPAYRAALVDFLGPKTAALCGDCQRRLDRNPLRVLDCKVVTCREIVAGAPSVLDHLGETSRSHFAGLRACLEAMGVPYEVNHRLVRGLDYYTGTVFEIVSSSAELGSQSTVVAGGRYDALVAALGGPETPAVGFAIGIERSVMCLPGAPESYDRAPDVFFATRGDAARGRALALATELRAAGLYAEVEHRAVGLKAQLKRANRLGARFVAVIGDEELAAGEVTLRDMTASAERRVSHAELAELTSSPPSTATAAPATQPRSRPTANNDAD